MTEAGASNRRKQVRGSAGRAHRDLCQEEGSRRGGFVVIGISQLGAEGWISRRKTKTEIHKWQEKKETEEGETFSLSCSCTTSCLLPWTPVDTSHPVGPKQKPQPSPQTSSSHAPHPRNTFPSLLWPRFPPSLSWTFNLLLSPHNDSFSSINTVSPVNADTTSSLPFPAELLDQVAYLH